MNIFKALSEGNGRITETNITSFMSYILDSTNELKNSFFLLFAHLIDTQLPDSKICELLDINQKTIREQILSFSSKYSVLCEPEYVIQKADGQRTIPDIILYITSKVTEEYSAFIIIENKINKAAKQAGQIERQLEDFKASDDYDGTKPVYSVYITPDENVFENIYKSAVAKHLNTAWLKWINNSDNEQSIEAIFRQLIKHEHNAEIEPIDPNTQFIIKSFIDYIATEFSPKENAKRNNSINGQNVVDMADIRINGKDYTLKRFSNNMIRLFDENDELLENTTRPFLRKINIIYNLGVDLDYQPGKAKNTQMLGKDIINKLNERI